MKGHIRNIFPGGNTPQGFYSYYNDILPQRKAEKIFCIKGGPGTGKSTLMKEVGNHFAEQGEDVDFLWCSSDPDSLDGIVLKKRRIALLDGTAPHVVDPQNPGAVDEILNLGEYWVSDEIRAQRGSVISCNERTSAMFQMVYGYLAAAGKRAEFLAEVLQRMLAALQEIAEQESRGDRMVQDVPRDAEKPKHTKLSGNPAKSKIPWNKKRPLQDTAGEKETEDIRKCSGRICGTSIIPYPPGIPLICPGEVLDDEDIQYVLHLRKRGEKVIGIDEQNRITVISNRR